MTTAAPDVTQHLWWLASRASGIVAMVLVSVSVGFGLALSTRLGARVARPAWLATAHEALALSGLAMILSHGLLLLGDPFLAPGLVGIAVPFALSSQPIWTALGIVAGWLAIVVVAASYMKRRLGNRLWRQTHYLTFGVWGLGLAHTLGSGSDAATAWLLALLALTSAPVVGLSLARLLGAPSGLSPVKPNKKEIRAT
ncbi:MAG: hypothetical protein QOG62_655 [Thermoleophilaceae bacterium]|jgi:sulfoxide reductase heme-binding subunit YedZ|nr:hypothetical protein [Thermoleophilaceae bacterium]